MPSRKSEVFLSSRFFLNWEQEKNIADCQRIVINRTEDDKKIQVQAWLTLKDKPSQVTALKYWKLITSLNDLGWPCAVKRYAQWSDVIHLVPILSWCSETNETHHLPKPFKLRKNVQKRLFFTLHAFQLENFKCNPMVFLALTDAFSLCNRWTWRHGNQPTQQCMVVMQSLRTGMWISLCITLQGLITSIGNSP